MYLDSTNLESVAWRLPYGESGILKFFLDILASEEQQGHGVKVQALRVTGNSCADTDANRARVVEGKYIISFINHLQDKSLVPYLIPVLYNVLVDYGKYFPRRMKKPEADTVRTCSNPRITVKTQ